MISGLSRTVTGSSLRAVFLTHLHSDHTVDYPNLLLFGLFTGLDRAASPLKVFGPGRRGQMAPVFSLPGAATRLFQLSILIIPRRVPKI